MAQHTADNRGWDNAAARDRRACAFLPKNLSAQAREARTTAGDCMGDLRDPTSCVRRDRAAGRYRSDRLSRVGGLELLSDRSSRSVAARRSRACNHRVYNADFRVLQRSARAHASAAHDHEAEVCGCDLLLRLSRMVSALLPSDEFANEVLDAELRANGIGDGIGVTAHRSLAFGFNHDACERFGAGVTNDDTAGIPE